MIVKVVFPWMTPSLNEVNRSNSRHWGVMNRLKKGWAKHLDNYLMVKYPMLSYNEKYPAKVKIERHGSRTLDRDNFVGGCKFLVDLLKGSLLIVDDSPRWVTVEYEQVKVPRKDGKTVVTVEIDRKGVR